MVLYIAWYILSVYFGNKFLYNNSSANKSDNYLDKSRQLVLVDVGNSAIKLGVANLDTGVLNQFTSFVSVKECQNYLKNTKTKQIFYSSVRPGFEIQSLCINSTCSVISAQPFINLEKLSFLESLDIGIDRKLACVAADEMVVQPFLVITMGTATSLSFVSDNICEFSVIWPGLKLAVNAIDKNTRIKVNPNLNSISTPGKTITIQDSVNLGVLFSTVFAIEKWVNHFSKLHNHLPNVVITGGYSKLISRHLNINHFTEPDLTIKGLLKLLGHREVQEELQIDYENSKG